MTQPHDQAIDLLAELIRLDEADHGLKDQFDQYDDYAWQSQEMCELLERTRAFLKKRGALPPPKLEPEPVRYVGQAETQFGVVCVTVPADWTREQIDAALAANSLTVRDRAD